MPLLPRLGLVASLLAACASPVAAVENGTPTVPFGVFDFGAGMMPPPTEYGTAGLRVQRYTTNQSRDDAGERSPVGTRVRVTSVGAAYVRMTDVSLGSAKLGWGAVLPVLDMDINLSVPTPIGPLHLSDKKSAQGDIQLFPILQWTPAPGWFTNLQLVFQLPTGAYDRTRLANPGVNHWSVVPTYSFTYIAPSGLEVSSSMQLIINGRNKDTDYRSGTEFQHEFAVGMHSGAWTWGLGGYWVRQLSDDKAGGVSIGNRTRALAVGPAVSYFELGSGLPLVWFHAYREVSARNRSLGTTVAVRAAWSF